MPPLPDFTPDKSNTTKYLLIAVAVLLVVGVSIGATLLFTRDGGGGGGGTTSISAAPSDVASANDTGPVAIITDEPTCRAFNSINNGLASVQKNGWSAQRADLGPATGWTPEQRSQVDAVVTSVRNAADQVVPLAKQTPNRVVRELYEQFIASAHAYGDSVPNYKPANDGLASIFVNSSSAVIGICNSIEYGSTGRSLALKPVSPPSQVGPVGDPKDSKLFITSSSQLCDDWISRLDKFTADTSPDWQNRDGSVPAAEWTPERRAIENAARPLLAKFADETETSGRESGNSVFEDLATAAAIYIRAFVAAGDTYVNADGWLSYTGFRIANLVAGACRATAD